MMEAHAYTYDSIPNININNNKRKINVTGRFSLINELNDNDFFSYKSFKLCLDSNTQNCDSFSIDHKINTMLLKINENNFQSVFNGILSLGVNNEEFLKIYTNTVFKHAILNHSLSYLYSVLTENIASVIKRTKYFDILKELLERKCIESFFLPNKTTNKWQLNLLHGVVIFTGYLIHSNLVSSTVFDNWKEDLYQNCTNKSLLLFINILTTSESSLYQDSTFINKLTSKIIESNDSNLIKTFNKFSQISKNDTSDEKQTTFNINKNHNSLFTRSDSVPLKLSSMASKMTMDQIVTQYVLNPNFSEFSKLLDDNNFSKNSIRTATEILQSLIKQPNENQQILLNLLCDMSIYQYFDEDQIKIALSNIISENKNDEKIGKSAILIYCRLLTEEIATFADFESLFGPMKELWKIIIPFFFDQIDNQYGSWVEEMLEVDFWRNLEFIESNSSIKQMEILEKLKIIDIFPEYEAIYDYYKQVKYNNKYAEIVLDEDGMSFEKQKLSEILFEILVSFNDSQMKVEGTKLKKYFSSFSSEIPKMAQKYGEKGLKLASIVQ